VEWGENYKVHPHERLLEMSTGTVHAEGTAITKKETAFGLLVVNFVQEGKERKFLTWDGKRLRTKSIYGWRPHREVGIYCSTRITMFRRLCVCLGSSAIHPRSRLSPGQATCRRLSLRPSQWICFMKL
jgi:hypothetical protein